MPSSTWVVKAETIARRQHETGSRPSALCSNAASVCSMMAVRARARATFVSSVRTTSRTRTSGQAESTCDGSGPVALGVAGLVVQACCFSVRASGRLVSEPTFPVRGCPYRSKRFPRTTRKGIDA